MPNGICGFVRKNKCVALYFCTSSNLGPESHWHYEGRRVTFKRMASSFLWALIPLTVFFSVIRLFFGVDFTDEAFLIAIAHRFWRGDIPFVDELFVHQTPVLLIAPWMRAYFSRFGTEGVVLYVRFLYLLFWSGITASLYFGLSQWMEKKKAIALSLLWLLFIPFNIPTLSYNTIGCGLWTAGLFLHLSQFPGRRFWVLLAWGLASIVYPTLIVMIVPTALIFTLKDLKKDRKAVVRWGVAAMTAAAVCLLLILPPILKAGDRFGDAITYSLISLGHGGGFAKLKLVLSHLFFKNIPPSIAILWIWAIAAVIFRKWVPLLVWALFPLILWWGYSHISYPGVWWANYFVFLPLVLFPRLKENSAVRQAFYSIWFPAFLAGILTAWSSISSAANAIIGFAPALIVSFWFLMEYCEWKRPVYFSVWISALLGLFAAQAFYCDKSLFQLTYRVQQGPYRGLFTSREKLDYLNAVTADIRRFENQAGYVFFYDFPAGYLLTEMRVGSSSSWVRPVSRAKQYYIDYYQHHLSPQNVVFLMKRLQHGYPSPVLYPPGDPVREYIWQSHQPIKETEAYSVWKVSALASQ